MGTTLNVAFELDENFHSLIDTEIDEWIKTKQLALYEKCYKRIEKRCLSIHFQEFCDTVFVNGSSDELTLKLENEAKNPDGLSSHISNLIKDTMHSTL